MKQQFSTPRTSDKEGSDPRGRENKREAPTGSYVEGLSDHCSGAGI